MTYKDEIGYLDFEDETQVTYYEVEIWRNGDCDDSRYFRTLRGAKAFFKSHAKSEADCIKKHDRGDCYIVVWGN